MEERRYDITRSLRTLRLHLLKGGCVTSPLREAPLEQHKDNIRKLRLHLFIGRKYYFWKYHGLCISYRRFTKTLRTNVAKRNFSRTSGDQTLYKQSFIFIMVSVSRIDVLQKHFGLQTSITHSVHPLLHYMVPLGRIASARGRGKQFLQEAEEAHISFGIDDGIHNYKTSIPYFAKNPSFSLRQSVSPMGCAPAGLLTLHSAPLRSSLRSLLRFASLRLASETASQLRVSKV